uniref:Coiled-coil domain-containing protein 22 n=1 Tax=Callorhinchus milii TaxID=7868 RepID=A0A4W3J2U9_CALMI
MEEVDRILLNSLRQSGADIAEDVESVRQLTTELIVECVVRCLRILNPALGNGVSHLLPPGMSARFRIGMCLAQACQELGYQGEIGYQTFLYSNEPEIRRLLMFLVEKLPRDSADTADQPAEKSVLLQRLIATKIKQQLASAWLPPALRTTSLLNTQAEEETRDRELSAEEKQQLLHIRKRALDLLPDAEGNLSKLQAVMEASAQRLVSLAGQWEKHRVPLIAEHRRLKQQLDSHELESSRRLMEIKEFHEKIKTSAEEAKRKENVHRQLVLELEHLSRGVGRAAYTQRILEIVSNISKQKEEITKDAKRDEAVRKAYKYLAALHENCSQLIETIEDTGTILREVRDLEELIDLETGKKTLINLEKILEDHRAIRQENAGLAGRLREA